MSTPKRFALFLTAFLALALTAPLPANAQRVDPRQSHYRIRAIDRVITDANGVRKPAHADGKLAFVAIYRGSSNICMVEYVFTNYKDFDILRADAANDPQINI